MGILAILLTSKCWCEVLKESTQRQLKEMDNKALPSSFIIISTLPPVFLLCLNVIKVSEFLKMSIISDLTG